LNYQDIKFQVEDGIGFITPNRPEKRNAISMNMMAEMIHLQGKFIAYKSKNLLLPTNFVHSFLREFHEAKAISVLNFCTEGSR